jgi:hypothetical protein
MKIAVKIMADICLTFVVSCIFIVIFVVFKGYKKVGTTVL